MTTTATPEARAAPEAPIQGEQRVTPLELFFDLVFVFAITQVTGFVSSDANWTRFVEGMAVLAVLWFVWEAFAWLQNTAASDEGAMRVVLLAAMGAMLIASLAVPKAFGDDALIFGVAYFAVRALHIGAYLIVSRGDPVLRAASLQDRVLIARDSYTYLHMPMVAGVIVFAIGVKKTLAGVDAQLDAVPAIALCGGVALYLLALSAFKRRNIGSFNVPRLVTAAALVALAPLALILPALLSLALVALIACALIGFEVFHYAEARDRIRHAA